MRISPVFGVLSLALVAVFSTPAWASSFVNAGFETGTFSGWTQTSGCWGAAFSPCVTAAVNNGVALNPSSFSSNPNWQGAVVTPGTDPNTGNLLNQVYAGNFAARLNNATGDYSVNVLSQFVANYTAADMYFDWAAVLLDSHGLTDSDNFTLQLIDNTTNTTVLNRSYNSAANGSIFSLYNSPIHGAVFWTPWQHEHIDLATLGIQGHDFTLQLLAADCPYGAHWGYVYLDGFEPTAAPPAQAPEPASLVLLGTGLIVAARARKGLNKNKAPMYGMQWTVSSRARPFTG